MIGQFVTLDALGLGHADESVDRFHLRTDVLDRVQDMQYYKRFSVCEIDPLP